MTIGVVGLGAMGLGIAQVFAQAGHTVRAPMPPNLPAPRRATGWPAALAPRVAQRRDDRSRPRHGAGRLVVVDRIEDIAPADLVIEAVAERLEVKAGGVARAGTLLPPMPCWPQTPRPCLSVPSRKSWLGRGRWWGCISSPCAGDETGGTRGPSRHRPRRDGPCPRAGRRGGQDGDRLRRPARLHRQPLRQALLWRGAGDARGRARWPPRVDAAMVRGGLSPWPLCAGRPCGRRHQPCRDRKPSCRDGWRHPRYHVFAALRDQVARGDLGRKTGRGFVHPAEPVAPPDDAAAIALRIEPRWRTRPRGCCPRGASLRRDRHGDAAGA